MTRISYFGLISVVFIIFFSFTGRMIFPFADEPDWTVRAPRVLFGEHLFWSPYNLFSYWLESLEIYSYKCQINAGALSLWAYIPSACNESFSQVVVRWLIMIFILLPFFYIIIFRRSFIQIMSLLNLKLSNLEWNLRIDALALSLIFPSMLFYLGVLAEEQFYLVVALYIFLFWGFWVPILSLFLVLTIIDFGNSIVAIFFVLSMFFLLKLRILNRKLFFFSVSLFIFFALVVGYRFLEFFLQLGIMSEAFTAKSEGIFNSLNDSELLTKYPIFLRPVVTFMSYVFMTPSGIKSPILYIMFFLLFIIISVKVLKKCFVRLDIYWFVPLSVIVFFVFLFPTYGNAKYYIFMMPFFVYVALNFYSREKIFLLASFSSMFVYSTLLIYRL